MSHFLNAYFSPCRLIKRDQIILGCGLFTMLGQVGGAVANRGDGILITAPYYSGFDPIFMMVHGLRTVPAMMSEKDVGTMNELRILEKTIHDSNASGIIVKAVLLCNPHNPLGRCYPKEVIEGYCRLCERYNLHLLSDEIFAMSVFATRDTPQPPSFISTLSIDLDRIGVSPARIHVLYGMSKDFNANGFRAGVLVSQSNPSLIRALTVTNPFGIVASPSDTLWSAILNDTKFLERFISTNRAKLSEACDYVTSWLRFHGLPYVRSHAAHFVMVDIRPIISDIERYGKLLGIKASDTMEAREIALVKYIHLKSVVLSPGSSHHYMEGGWIRLSFAVRRDYLDIALTRMEEALMWEKWPGLGVSLESPLTLHAADERNGKELPAAQVRMKARILCNLRKFSLIPFIPCVGDAMLEFVGEERKELEK